MFMKQDHGVDNVATTVKSTQCQDARMVYHCRKSPPAPNVQPPNETLQPVMSFNFRNRHLTYSLVHSFSSLFLTHTQMSLT